MYILEQRYRKWNCIQTGNYCHSIAELGCSSCYSLCTANSMLQVPACCLQRSSDHLGLYKVISSKERSEQTSICLFCGHVFRSSLSILLISCEMSSFALQDCHSCVTWQGRLVQVYCILASSLHVYCLLCPDSAACA